MRERFVIVLCGQRFRTCVSLVQLKPVAHSIQPKHRYILEKCHPSYFCPISETLNPPDDPDGGPL